MPRDDDWDKAQHRIRNDFHTLSGLIRLSRGRIPDGDLLDAAALWISIAPSLYIASPPWDTRAIVSVESLFRALTAGEKFERPFQAENLEESAQIPASSALAALLCIHGLLTFSCRRAAPGSTVRVDVPAGAGTAGLSATFTLLPGHETAAPTYAWPPTGLDRAAEALGARWLLETRERQQTATLLLSTA